MRNHKIIKKFQNHLLKIWLKLTMNYKKNTLALKKLNNKKLFKNQKNKI